MELSFVASDSMSQCIKMFLLAGNDQTIICGCFVWLVTTDVVLLCVIITVIAGPRLGAGDMSMGESRGEDPFLCQDDAQCHGYHCHSHCCQGRYVAHYT